MTQEEGFLQAILEAPDDDTPRLVYADWLDDHGQPERAEFIRVQCTLARLPEGNPGRTDLEAREKVLLAEHQEKWLAPLRDILDDWVFHRGMLGVAVSVPGFLAHAAVLARSPLIHYLDIVDHAVGRTGIEALGRSPYLQRVTILNLAGWYCYDDPTDLLDDEQTALLANSPYVSRLTTLNLRCNCVGDEGIRALVVSDRLTNLEELDLRVNLFGDEGLLALASSPLLGRLRFLDLAYDEGRARTDAGWRSLAAASYLDRLGGLYLAGNNISEATRAILRARLGNRVQF